MTVFREQRRRLVGWDERWDAFEAATRQEIAALGATMSTLEACYRPVAVDLTTRESRAVGLFVYSVWSSTAVDFPGSDRPIERARWTPSATAERLLDASPGLFRP